MDCDRLVVQCTAPFPTDFNLRLDYTSKARVQPGQHELVVNHNLSIRRQSLGRFYTEGPRPAQLPADAAAWTRAFEKWVDEACARATHETFHGQSYAEVSLGFTKFCEQLKTTVEKDFARIGFTALPIHTLPLDPEIQICLEKKVTFDTGDIPCKTRESTVDYALSAHVSLEIASLDEIKKYLRPGHPLKTQFTEVARETIKNTVRTLDPQILYTKFTAPDPDTKEPTPEEKITTALKTALREKFDAREANMGITLSPVPTEVTRLFDALRPYAPQRCTVAVQSGGRRGEDLTFHVDYCVASIAPGGWPTFQEQCRKLPGTDVAEKARLIFAAMDAALTTKARAKLQTFTPAELASRNPNLPGLIQSFGLADAQRQIAAHLGLLIQVTNVEPTVGKWTTREQELEDKYYTNAETDYDTASEQHCRLLLEYGPDDPRVVEARARVDKCKTELERFGTGHDEAFKSGPALPAPDWDKVLRLGEGSNDSAGQGRGRANVPPESKE